MLPTKRTWSEIDDSDEDEPSLGRQVLPVANLPENFNGEPMDGLQYLFTVRRDARTLPHATRVPNPYELKEEPPSLAQRPSVAHLLPSKEWREVFIRGFRNLRKNVLETVPQEDFHRPPPGTHKIIPDKKERDFWWAFLSGKPETEWNPPKKPKVQKVQNARGKWVKLDQPQTNGMRSLDAPEEGEVETSPSTVVHSLPTPSTPSPPDYVPGSDNADGNMSGDVLPLLKEPCVNKGREPTPVLLRDIDHRYSLHLLMYFAHWITLHTDQPQSHSLITSAHGRWMFALLSRVEDYVTADEMSLLRNLARACMSLIREILQSSQAGNDGNASLTRDANSIGLSSCWMIVTAVAEVWAQRDLWMDVESTLSETLS